MTDITINEILYNDIFNLIKTAKENVKTAINLSMVYTYYEIGKRIFLEEQKRHERAVYGDALIDNLSNKLKKEFGNGFSKDNLKLMRRFYVIYSNDEIGEPVVLQLIKVRNYFLC